MDVIREGQNLPSQRLPVKDIHLSNTNYSIRQHLVKFSASSIKNKEELFKYKEAKVPFGAKRNAQQHPLQAILPLQRPSGTRISRILEGSMDIA